MEERRREKPSACGDGWRRQPKRTLSSSRGNQEKKTKKKKSKATKRAKHHHSNMSSTTNDQKKPEPQQQQEQPQQEQQQQQSPSTHEASPAAQPETKPEEKKQKYSQEEVISILAAGIQQLQSPPPPLPADASEEASEHFNFAMIDLFDGLEMTPAATQKLLAQVSQNNKDNKKEGELKTLDLQKLQAESKEQADKVPMVRGPAGYFVDEQRKQYVAVSMGHPFLLFASTE